MFIRFYNKCLICDTVYYEPEKNGCTYPSITCSDCRKYYDRGISLRARHAGPVDYKFIRHLLDRDECEYCGKKLKWEEREIEHKTPVSKGGDNSNSNLCISCHQCNVEKGERTYDEYIAYRKTLKITASDIKTMLDVFSKHVLLETEDRIVETVEHKSEAYINKLIRNEEGRPMGIRKVYLNPESVRRKKKISKTHLTEWGEAYNTFCKIVGRKLLKEGEKTVILEEEDIIA